MLIVTTESVPGREVTQVHGLVRGASIRAKHVGRDIGASLKGLVGGELKGYSDLLEEARDEAIERLTAEARATGADAVVAVRFTTSQIAGAAAEVYAYGTAVTLR